MHGILVLWGPKILRAFMVDLGLIPEQTKCEERAMLSDNKNKKMYSYQKPIWKKAALCIQNGRPLREYMF